jgi:hypothetical protein
MVKGNKTIVAKQLIKEQNQLDDHNEVKKIIREELMNHIQGAGFWDSLKANLGGIIGSGMPPAASASASGSKGTGPLAAPEAPASKPAKAPKKTRKVNPKMAERYALIKQLMKTEGLTMPQASKRAAEIQNKA